MRKKIKNRREREEEPRERMSVKVLLFVILAQCLHLTPAEKGTFWHITDFHYDANYTESTGSTADMCWAVASVRGRTSGKSPGKFGDYACDAPLALVNSAVDAMQRIYPNPDFILWTGDDTAHVSDQYFSEDKVLEIISTLTSIIHLQFQYTLVIPVLGNHDFHPKNQAPIGVSSVQSRVAEMWAEWLGNISTEAYNSFNASGRYWADIPNSSVTVVALNTLLWYESNDLTSNIPDSDPDGLDPDQQFAWADELLTQLSERKRRVYLVGHIPPGSFERYQQTQAGFHWYQERYNDRFIQMVVEHADAIEAQFFAHHHTDSFRLFFKQQETDDPGVPISYQLIAPGVTPWRSTLSPETGANNPGIRLITYDRNSGQLLEISTYYLNLTKANLEGEADWTLEYNFTSTYDLDSITPTSLYSLAKDLKGDRSVFDKYYQANTVSLEDPAKCTPKCQNLHWCTITEVEYTRFSACNIATVTSFNSAMALVLMILSMLIR